MRLDESGGRVGGVGHRFREVLLERVVPSSQRRREKLLAFLLGPRSEQIPVADGALCLGQWQRILLFSLDAQHRPEWTLTLLG